MTFRLLPLWLLVLALAAVPVAAAGLPVAEKTLAFKNKNLDISVKYPQTGNKAIDAALADYAKKAVADFKTFDSDAATVGQPYMLETGYTVARNDGKMFAVLFNIFADTGGAHPNSDYATFNFLLPDGAQVFLPEIVDGARGIKRVTDLVQADLIKRIGTGDDALSDKETIGMGTTPIADSYKDFIWEPGALHIYFPPYQVAAYAAGPQESVIPLAKLKDVMRSDWRAPAASFDCAKAATTIEHAICADAALARLDRQVAEAWQAALHNTYEPADKDKLKQAQRDWLAKRNAACSGAAPGACLVKSYRDRLAVLQKYPG